MSQTVLLLAGSTHSLMRFVNSRITVVCRTTKRLHIEPWFSLVFDSERQRSSTQVDIADLSIYVPPNSLVRHFPSNSTDRLPSGTYLELHCSI